MESKGRIIPTKDVDFNLKQEIIADRINANASAWGLDMNWITAKYNPAKNRWDIAWHNYQDVYQRTQLITFEKNQARENYEPLVRIIVKNLEANTLVSDEARAEMGIFPPKPRTPNKKPTTFPDAFVKSDIIRELTVYFRDHESLSRGKPHGIHGAEIRWAILDHQPQDVNELIHSEFDTHSPFTLEFKESERGQTIWFCLRWESTRGEKGPWSEFISAIIP
jgi:hypothetical protein